MGQKNANDDEITKALKQASAWEFISKLPKGLSTNVEQSGNNFSGGQKQRLSIARALIKQPKIIILDDSTSAVDSITDRQIQKSIAKTLRNSTIIIIAQRISSVKNADQIIVMNKGSISDIGTHRQLMKRSTIYKDIYQTQEHEVGDG